MNRKMRISIVPFFLLAALMLVSSVSAQKITVNTTVDSTQIWIGQQTRVVFELTQPQDKWVQSPVFADKLIDGIELVEPVSNDTATSADGHLVVRQSYTVTSFTDSLYLIPAYPFVPVGSTDTVWSNPVSLKVIQPFEIDTAANAITDIKEVMDPPFSWKYFLKTILPWIIAFHILLAIVYFILKLLRNKPEKRSLEPVIKVPPYVWAMEQLQQLKEEKLWQQNLQKEYFTRLTDILRGYIEKSYSIPAPELTSDEILGQLIQLKKENKEAFTRLQQLLQLADLVKFAKWYATPVESEQSLSNAIEFLNLTKTEEKKEDDIS